MDDDDDRCISLQEFNELNIKGVDSNEVKENLKDTFFVFNMDGNEFIIVEKLNMVMQSLR